MKWASYAVHESPNNWPLTRYSKLRVAHALGVPWTFSPPPRICDPDMHHGTCVMHMPWCMTRSLTSGFLWSRRGKSSRHTRCMRNPQLYVSGNRNFCFQWNLIEKYSGIGLIDGRMILVPILHQIYVNHLHELMMTQSIKGCYNCCDLSIIISHNTSVISTQIYCFSLTLPSSAVSRFMQLWSIRASV